MDGVTLLDAEEHLENSRKKSKHLLNVKKSNQCVIDGLNKWLDNLRSVHLGE